MTFIIKSRTRGVYDEKISKVSLSNGNAMVVLISCFVHYTSVKMTRNSYLILYVRKLFHYPHDDDEVL